MRRHRISVCGLCIRGLKGIGADRELWFGLIVLQAMPQLRVKDQENIAADAFGGSSRERNNNRNKLDFQVAISHRMGSKDDVALINPMLQPISDKRVPAE